MPKLPKQKNWYSFQTFSLSKVCCWLDLTVYERGLRLQKQIQKFKISQLKLTPQLVRRSSGCVLQRKRRCHMHIGCWQVRSKRKRKEAKPGEAEGGEDVSISQQAFVDEPPYAEDVCLQDFRFVSVSEGSSESEKAPERKKAKRGPSKKQISEADVCQLCKSSLIERENIRYHFFVFFSRWENL